MGEEDETFEQDADTAADFAFAIMSEMGRREPTPRAAIMALSACLQRCFEAIEPDARMRARTIVLGFLDGELEQRTM